MKCAWNAFLGILPQKYRVDVDKLGRESLQELRLRLNGKPELVTVSGSQWLKEIPTPQDLAFVVNMASRYSPWAAASAAQGYLTAPGGHRIGLCGETVTENGCIKGIREPTALCLRVARDFEGIAGRIPISGNILILGPPGSGKTTLLRDLIRRRSNAGCGSVAVVDERGELFPVTREGNCFEAGMRTDVLTGCTKPEGIERVLRTMGPACIAVDEITSERDCRALLAAAWCGVTVFATAHASSTADLQGSAIYTPLVDCGVFENAVTLRRDKTYIQERLI